MSNEILNSLIKEYEQKKLLAELDLEKRKNDLYKKVPKLKQIEDDLNQFAINTAKNILKNNEASINELEIKASQLKKEKIEILKELNLPTDYLQPFYECKICNDTGYIMNNNYKTEMCNCLKQKLLNYSFNKSNMSNLDKENFLQLCIWQQPELEQSVLLMLMKLIYLNINLTFLQEKI